MEDNLLDDIIWDTDDDGVDVTGDAVAAATPVATTSVSPAATNATPAVATPAAASAGATGSQNSADAAKAAAERAQANADRLNTLGQNVSAAQGKVGDAVTNMNNIAAGKVNGMADILAQYGPKETPEQMEARKRKERNTGNILAMLNMLQGVANVVTASSGSTGRYAGSVDVVKPYQQGIMAAEAERKANDAAREKARQAYIDKALSRAKIDYDAAQKDLGAARAAEENERKRQATEYEKGEQRKHDMQKALIASNDRKAAMDQRERFHLDDVKYKNKSLGLKQQALELQKQKAANSGSGSGSGGSYEYIVDEGNLGQRIKLPKNVWENNEHNVSAVYDKLAKLPDSKVNIDSVMGEDPDKTPTHKQMMNIIGKYVASHPASNPVSNMLRELAGEEKVKEDFFGDEGGSTKSNGKLLF